MSKQLTIHNSNGSQAGQIDLEEACHDCTTVQLEQGIKKVYHKIERLKRQSEGSR